MVDHSQVRKRPRNFIVSLVVPRGVTEDMMKDYIAEAVAGWKGQLKPASSMTDAHDWYDPLTDIDASTIVVTASAEKHRKENADAPSE